MAQLPLSSPNWCPESSYLLSDYRPSSRGSTITHEPYNDDEATSDADSDVPLPFPTALSRRDFLVPDFDPAAYLSALHAEGPTARHQTLEDLRTELRDRSAAISAELLELVNANYTAFLGLGDELKGGEERVEDVRVALLGFRRAVEEVQAQVRDRRVDVEILSRDLRGVRRAVEMGRKMLELDARVAALEARLAIGGAVKQRREDAIEEDDGWDEVEDSEDDNAVEDEKGMPSFTGSSPAKLTALARDYIIVDDLATGLGRDLPIVKMMEERMAKCRNTVLLDLGTAVKEARAAGTQGQARTLDCLAAYRVLGAETEAIQALRK